ncbi:MAG: nitroreductase family protein [Dehalococcoidia bacterium]|nr:nitroreductase family protein [Dehalococcoidia bacterium]
MDAIQAILSRRSIRRYTDKKVPDDAIKTLLEAAMAAPSANNKQPWHFVVVTDRKILDAVPAFHPYAKMLFEATAAILVCGDESVETTGSFLIQGCSAAVQNILVSANVLGLGTVWLSSHPREERMDGFRELFRLPAGVIPVALISIGYPAEEKLPSGRYDESRVHWNSW